MSNCLPISHKIQFFFWQCWQVQHFTNERIWWIPFQKCEAPVRADCSLACKNPLNLPVPLPKLDALVEKASTPKADKAVGPDRRSWPQRAAGLGLVEKPLGSVGPERRAERGSRCRAPQPGEMPVQDDAAVQRTGRLPPRRTHCVYT